MAWPPDKVFDGDMLDALRLNDSVVDELVKVDTVSAAVV